MSMQLSREGDFFLKEEIQQAEHRFGFTLDQIASICQLDPARILSDQLNEEEHQRLFSLVSGILILDHSIKTEDVLSGLIEHLHHHYGLRLETIAKACFLELEDVQAVRRQEAADIDAYQMFVYLYRLHNILSSCDPDYGTKKSR